MNAKELLDGMTRTEIKEAIRTARMARKSRWSTSPMAYPTPGGGWFSMVMGDEGRLPVEGERDLSALLDHLKAAYSMPLECRLYGFKRARYLRAREMEGNDPRGHQPVQ